MKYLLMALLLFSSAYSFCYLNPVYSVEAGDMIVHLSPLEEQGSGILHNYDMECKEAIVKMAEDSLFFLNIEGKKIKIKQYEYDYFLNGEISGEALYGLFKVANKRRLTINFTDDGILKISK